MAFLKRSFSKSAESPPSEDSGKLVSSLSDGRFRFFTVKAHVSKCVYYIIYGCLMRKSLHQNLICLSSVSTIFCAVFLPSPGSLVRASTSFSSSCSYKRINFYAGKYTNCLFWADSSDLEQIKKQRAFSFIMKNRIAA